MRMILWECVHPDYPQGTFANRAEFDLACGKAGIDLTMTGEGVLPVGTRVSPEGEPVLEPRGVMPVGRIEEDALRHLVNGVLDGSQITTQQMRAAQVPLSFLPMALGALAPPEELRTLLMGSEAPPEVPDPIPMPEPASIAMPIEEPPPAVARELLSLPVVVVTLISVRLQRPFPAATSLAPVVHGRGRDERPVPGASPDARR